MSPAVKTRKKAAKAEEDVIDIENHMEHLEESRIRDDLQAYRDAVHKAASGYRHEGSELSCISGVMHTLGIPGHAWKKDIEAVRRMKDAEAKQDELLGRQKDREIEAQQLAAEHKQIQRRLGEVKARLHVVTVVEPNTLASYGHRQGELRLNHPHVFAPLGEMVKERIQALQAKAAPKVGWLP